MISKLGRFLTGKKVKPQSVEVEKKQSTNNLENDPRFKNVQYGSLTLRHPVNRDVLAEMTDDEVKTMTYDWKNTLQSRLKKDSMLMLFVETIKDIGKANEECLKKVIGDNISISYIDSNKKEKALYTNETAAIKLNLGACGGESVYDYTLEVFYCDKSVMKIDISTPDYYYGYPGYLIDTIIPGRWLNEVLELIATGTKTIVQNICDVEKEKANRIAEKKARQNVEYLSSPANKLKNISVTQLKGLSPAEQVSYVDEAFIKFVNSAHVDLEDLYEILMNCTDTPEYKKIIDYLGITDVCPKGDTVSFCVIGNKNIKYTLTEDDYDMALEYTLEMKSSLEEDGSLSIKQSGNCYAASFVGGASVNSILEIICDKAEPALKMCNNYTSCGAALSDKQLIELSMSME